ncbi:MAG TPA: alpha/beta hydrolase, partial [Ktedonobacteraceae bacterium]|nr:alpha/beta hydrolase [Ktedonobacteraceae bacterium]
FMRDNTMDKFPEAERQRMQRVHQYGDEQIQALFRHGQSFKDTYDDMNFTPPYLSTIAARTLIAYGDRDPLLPVHIALEQYAAIPHSYLWVVPNGGHVPVFSGISFMEAVLPFLRGDWEQE